MFGLFNNVIESTLNVGESLLDIEAPKKRDVVALVDAGLTAVVISQTLGVSMDFVEGIMDGGTST